MNSISNNEPCDLRPMWEKYFFDTCSEKILYIFVTLCSRQCLFETVILAIVNPEVKAVFLPEHYQTI